jgi:hypothetical protein
MKRDILSIVLLLTCSIGWTVHAADAELSAEDEAKIEAQEDADPDAKMAAGLKGIFTGTLLLDSPDQPAGRGVIGNLTLASGKNYLVRLGDETLMEKIKPYNGKSATVTGKIRVNGKYLIILSIVPPASDSPPREKRKRNGL